MRVTALLIIGCLAFSSITPPASGPSSSVLSSWTSPLQQFFGRSSQPENIIGNLARDESPLTEQFSQERSSRTAFPADERIATGNTTILSFFALTFLPAQHGILPGIFPYPDAAGNPHAPPGMNFVILLLLMYFVLLSRSNLPAEAVRGTRYVSVPRRR